LASFWKLIEGLFDVFKFLGFCQVRPKDYSWRCYLKLFWVPGLCQLRPRNWPSHRGLVTLVVG
jgi:hypothetical protein